MIMLMHAWTADVAFVNIDLDRQIHEFQYQKSQWGTVLTVPKSSLSNAQNYFYCKFLHDFNVLEKSKTFNALETIVFETVKNYS